MERIGQVNRYKCQDCSLDTFTINLNSGTTPFGITCPHCGQPNSLSSMYRLPTPRFGEMNVNVTHAYYRPSPERLAELNAEFQAKYPNVTNCWDQHVLNGGLVLGKLGEVTPMIEKEPPYDGDDWEKAQPFFQATYGRTLERPEWMDRIPSTKKE